MSEKPFPSTAKEAQELRKSFYLGSQSCPVHNTRARWTNSGKCMACADNNGEALIDMRNDFEKLILKRKEDQLEADRLRHERNKIKEQRL